MPEPIGLAATGYPALVEEFGDIARQEYLAVGIRTALHPMADLAKEDLPYDSENPLFSFGYGLTYQDTPSG